ncbi:hypothetical protein OG920_00740 [Streptomyces europaeiscabiei]|uniref:hypothetical protein n=1 Tax=Streptomyces TaxID=1883 RepID=UPI0015C50655|nr:MULTISPECIES: hypothetical protein [Streptomyces]MDX3586138.1 hypothetical protein [Streptomyces europaeiscabiei]MDX3615437.1 hypothetical protein [Streptomyces europaeiscabiei]MDX3636131.1 hypothetical protein [Streptomyces europaeiscabiei]MDX3654291.1 hypothetical protein [Streptomyces europaeiscabiei]WUD30094.1 hypothetical protein OG858_00805 [Streptomyces europaeiscabiei]
MEETNQFEVHPYFQQAALQRTMHADYGILTQARSPIGGGPLCHPQVDRAARIAENFDVFGFELTAEQLTAGFERVGWPQGNDLGSRGGCKT